MKNNKRKCQVLANWACRAQGQAMPGTTQLLSTKLPSHKATVSSASVSFAAL